MAQGKSEIFLEIKNDIELSANDFANYLCRMVSSHLEGKVTGISGNEKWEDGSPAQLVFALNIGREDADNLVSEMNEEEPNEPYGSWFLADEDENEGTAES